MSRKSALIILATLTALALAAGCGSTSSLPTVIDTAPPATPTGLAVAGAPLGLLLSWDPNTTDADFAGFVVRRTVHGNETVLVDMPTEATQYLDPAPISGCLNRYDVSSVDQSGNESGFACLLVDLTRRVPDLRPLESPAGEPLIGEAGSPPLPVGAPDHRNPY
ncbi:MAG: hypothetical protein ACYDIE_01150 [Candidatus Krumholzibacteriia bacterium]